VAGRNGLSRCRVEMEGPNGVGRFGPLAVSPWFNRRNTTSSWHSRNIRRKIDTAKFTVPAIVSPCRTDEQATPVGNTGTGGLRATVRRSRRRPVQCNILTVPSRESVTFTRTVWLAGSADRGLASRCCLADFLSSSPLSATNIWHAAAALAACLAQRGRPRRPGPERQNLLVFPAAGRRDRIGTRTRAAALSIPAGSGSAAKGQLRSAGNSP
jgi:hypothetical protein